MKPIDSILNERASFTIRDKDEHTKLRDDFRANTASPLTDDSLRAINGIWARSEFLWNTKPNLAPPPQSPDGGSMGAMREGARLAA